MAAIEKISFDLEVITPMFLGGSDGKTAELRPASLKGLMRYWWRSLQVESDLNELREREGKIFGSSDEKKSGASSFAIRLSHQGSLRTSKEKFPKQNIKITSKGKTFPINILEYLAYGAFEYIPQGIKFRIHLNFFNGLYITEILKTMFIFSLFGGIGAKSRNGFGSFAILNKKEVFKQLATEFSVIEPYTKENLQKFVKQTSSQSYMSFSKDTKVFKTKNTYDTWDKALAKVGRIYRGIRSGDIRSKDEKNGVFEKKHEYSKRQYIGSPIIVDKQEKSFLERHAKPYFIKVAKEDETYRSYILYLSSRYCDGLDKDRNTMQINHSKVNEEFTNICDEFNKFLASEMETVL